MTRSAAAAACAGFLAFAVPGGAHAAIGDLTQLTGALGCTHNVNSFGCAPGTSLDQPEQIAVSADGKSAYVASTSSDAVAIFDYDPADGSLTQKDNPDGCISPDGSGGTCRIAKALSGPHDLAVSPDGKNVYVGGFDGLAILDRDPATGNLSQQPGGPTAGCVTATGSGGTCSTGKGIGVIQGVAVSPDNDNVYVVTYGNDTVATFDRDETTGA
ncbi:MAG TPA: beta-propeller fold lactonase family protein, partial [Solirubrobacteraceae bacterium]